MSSNRSSQFSKKALQGFTLVEMLVVLVIVSLTTTLLMTGLSTTWRNFEKLGARDLTVSAGQMSATWFRRSIEGAVMYHPMRSDFSGSEDVMQMVSIFSPASEFNVPSTLRWEIRANENGWALWFDDKRAKQRYQVMIFDQQPFFEYLTSDGWSRTFDVTRNALPRTIRLMTGNTSWMIVSPLRPLLSDMPAEFPSFERYEF